MVIFLDVILAPMESADSQLSIGAYHHKTLCPNLVGDRPKTPNPPKSRPSQKLKNIMSAPVLTICNVFPLQSSAERSNMAVDQDKDEQSMFAMGEEKKTCVKAAANDVAKGKLLTALFKASIGQQSQKVVRFAFDSMCRQPPHFRGVVPRT